LPARGQPKVSDLDILNAVWTCADEDVLGLEVPMHDIEAMDVDQTLKYLTKQPPYFLSLLVKTPGYQIA
jgi:hypothetical protein